MRTIGKLLSIALALVAIVCFVEGLISHDAGVLSVAAFCAWGMAILTAMCREEKNIIYIFFLITFFIFLLSRVMVRWLRFGEIYTPFSIEVMMMIYSCLITSLFGLAIGTATAHIRFGFGKRHLKHLENARIENEKSNWERKDNVNLDIVRQISGAATVICGFAMFFVVIERIAFWRISGYGGDLRTSFTSTLPDFILRLSYIYVMMFCIYLASLPEKRRCMPIILQYLIVSALRMFYGSRVSFVVGLMFILIYFTIRDRLIEWAGSEEKKWFSRTELTFTVVSIPLLIILMVFVGNYRTHQGFEFTSFLDTLGDFFEAQGTSINVIGYTDIYKDKFTQPKYLYLFDRTYEFLTTNPIGSIISGRHAYMANSIERAQYGTSLDMTLYYHINQVSYLAGNGCGSSYVAEAWLGYGYTGLFLINVGLARIMARLNEYRFRSFFSSVFILIFIQSLFFMPRSKFDTFVDDFASITHIFAIILLWVAYWVIKRKRA